MIEAEGDYVSGGYYVARPSKRADYMSSELMPDEVISASKCICDFFPDDWAIEWTTGEHEHRLAAVARFGIPPSSIPDIVKWATESFSVTFGWPNTFYSLDAARQARARLLPEEPRTVLFGLGLHRNDVEKFLTAARPPAQQPGFAPVGATGIFECVRSGEMIAGGGEFAGFELLSTVVGLLDCTWLCNGLETKCASDLGIRPNTRGFVQTRAEALRCAEFISREDVPSEPGPWFPWRVTIYATT